MNQYRMNWKASVNVIITIEKEYTQAETQKDFVK